MKSGFRPSKVLLCVLFVLLGLVVSPGPAGAVTQYTVTDLGTLGGSESHAWGINGSGEVVGHARTAGGDLHAFLWLPAPAYGMLPGIHDLGTLGGSYSSGFDINASGQVAGSAHSADGDLHAFLWLPTPDYGLPAGMNLLGTFGGSQSGANAINASGQVVGSVDDGGGFKYGHAFLWENGVIREDLGNLGGTRTDASGISNSGQVVGASRTASGDWHAFLWDGVMHDLGTLGHPWSWAYEVNASGQVVGWVGTSSVSGNHAFLWEDDVMQDLGPGQAFGINAPGQVVGWKDGHAFLWEDGGAFDLNGVIIDGSGWVLASAEGVNDLGQIVGWGTHDGQTHAFLLTPIPEPSVLGVLALAFLAALRRVRRGQG